MKKSELITGVILTLAGAAALAAALLTETAFDGIFWGVAGAGLCLGIGMVIRFFRWSAPDRSEQYREILENKARSGEGLEKVGEEMQEEWGDTYWWYNIFGRKVFIVHRNVGHEVQS